MGVRNRERRRAKQRARQQRQQPPPGPQPGDGSGDWPGAPPPRGPAGATVDELLAGAIHVRQCPDHDDTEHDRALAALAAAPRQRVDRGVLTWLQHAVSRAWEGGWQPADLVRVAYRRCGARPARLATDAIAAELRGYPAATVDHRWAAQLTELGAGVWWEHDDGYLEAWGTRERLDRVEVLGCAVGLLAMVHLLPVLPRLCPPPGTARPGAAAGGPAAAGGSAAVGGSAQVDERALDRVRALLAKAEATTFPEEAEAYTAKAQELMARHSIAYALLAARGPVREEPAARRLGVDNPYEQPKALLLGCIAEANRCRAVWDKSLGFSTVVGFPGDLDAVELLYTSLLVQATAAMLHEGSRRDRDGRSRTRSFRQSFLTAYASRIGQRLRTATEEATRSAAAETSGAGGDGGADLLPVLAARDEEVHEAMDELFPGLVPHQVRVTDREGWISGTAAADRASLTAHHQVTE